MAAAHYPLQALLYSVALHRYLRWRQPDYDPDRHLGGVLYLFVRGMSAVEPTVVGDTPCGVWSWRPPAGLVAALSDLFDHGVRAMTTSRTVESVRSLRRVRGRAAQQGACAPSTGRGSSTARTSTSPTVWPSSPSVAGVRAKPSPSGSPSPPGRRGSATSASTCGPSGRRPAGTPTWRPTSTRCPGPIPRRGSTQWRRARSSGRAARSGCRGRTCTWTASGSTSDWWRPNSWPGPNAPRPTSTWRSCAPAWRRCSARSTRRRRIRTTCSLAAAAAVLRRRVGHRRRAGDREDDDGGPAAGAARPAGAGPGRRPPLVALAAPTGKAALRLEDAVRQARRLDMDSGTEERLLDAARA